MHYLDPRSPNPDMARHIATVGTLAGKTVGFLNNGWASMAKIGQLIEHRLKAEHGAAQVLFFEVPRSLAPPPGLLERVTHECQAAIVGMAN